MLVFRAPDPDDFALVADSFWYGVRECPSVFGLPRAFVVGMLNAVVVDPKWNVTILCDDNQADEILCWCIWQSPTRIFWISVKPRYEGCGFASQMLTHIGLGVTNVDIHKTINCPILPPRMLARAGKHGIRLVQRPYLTMA